MKLIKLSLAAAVLATGMLAADESEIGISANVAATSNYVWRGMTQSDDNLAIQGGVDVDFKGFYVGAWASSVDFDTTENSTEIDVYLGYAGEFSGVSYDVGFIEYIYEGSMDAANFGEAYVSVGYDFKVVSVSAAYYLGVDTHDSELAADDWEPTDAWELSASVPLPMDISIDATYGDYDEVGAYYLLGVNKSFGKFDFTLAYTANDADGNSAAEQDNVVLTAGTSF